MLHKLTFPAFASAFLALAWPADAGETPQQTHLDASCLVSVWAPDSKKLATDKKWRPQEFLNRLDYADDAPSEDGDAMATTGETGQPGGMVSYKGSLAFAKKHNPTVSRIQAEIYFDSVDAFNKAGAKLPLGIWGVAPDQKYCGAGLCAPSQQTGFSVRLTRSRIDTQSEERPMGHAFLIYSYHLNRPGEEKQTTSKSGGTRPTLKGDGIATTHRLEAGVWYTVVLDVGLNSFDGDTPVADGWTHLYLMDDTGAILDWVGKSGLIYRKAPDWRIMGPYLVDLWGGDPTKKQNLPLSDILTYFEDYEMFFLDPEKSLSDCLTPM